MPACQVRGPEDLHDTGAPVCRSRRTCALFCLFVCAPDLKPLGVALMTIGHALVLRGLLHGAVGECIDRLVPSLGAIADDTQQQSTSSADVWKVRVVAATCSASWDQS